MLTKISVSQMSHFRHKLYMRSAVLTLAIVSAAMLPKFCCSQEVAQVAGREVDRAPETLFQGELRKRYVRDQSIRIAIIRFTSGTKNKKSSEEERKRYLELLKKGSDTDQSNLEWLKKVIVTHGFPSYSVLGARSAQEFFVLMVHMDRDRKFQKRCLAFMQKEDAGWPKKYLRMMEIRLKQPKPPTIKIRG